jgi:hypothetical protein
MKTGLACIVMGLCLAAGNSPVLAQANNTQVSVLPPNSSPHGKTYAEWSVKWWQWFLSIPEATNPSAGGPCATGQSGKVWFLAGLFSPSPTPVICTVPTGTMLFFPIVNLECSNVEPAPFYGGTPAEREACARSFLDGLENDLELTLMVDGKSVSNLKKYRTASGDFSFAAPHGAVFGIPQGTWQAAADGYYVMLAPLTRGPHIIRFTASIGGQAIIDTTHSIFVSTQGR